MKKSVRMLQLILLAGSVFLLLGSVTYAWFSKVDQTDVIVVDTASLKVQVDLYEAGHSPISPSDEDYQLVESSISFGRVIPGEIYHFKLVVKNVGTIPGDLTIKINQLDLEHSIGLSVDLFKFRIENESRNILLDDDNILFSNIEVQNDEEVVLLFAIEVNGDSFSEIKADFLRINHINIRLDQIQP